MEEIYIVDKLELVYKHHHKTSYDSLMNFYATKMKR